MSFRRLDRRNRTLIDERDEFLRLFILADLSRD